jgi:zinc-ribbon domain
MISCPKCGASNPDDAEYCRNCGASLTRIAPPGPVARLRREADYISALSGGVILIILAVTYLRFPVGLTVIRSYFETMLLQQRYIRPPQLLFSPTIFFFECVGLWSIVVSVLRLILQRSVRKAIGDFSGTLFAFFVAFLITNYADGTIAGRTLLAYFIVGIGLLAIVNALASHREKDSVT